jgi:hypothetical protein
MRRFFLVLYVAPRQNPSPNRNVLVIMDEPNSSSVGRAMENKKTDFHFAVRRLRCESLELTAQSRKRKESRSNE